LDGLDDDYGFASAVLYRVVVVDIGNALWMVIVATCEVMLNLMVDGKQFRGVSWCISLAQEYVQKCADKSNISSSQLGA
jgi:hypothetical protein